ncbi:MAG: tryptophan--tRNA ligase [Xanthomonadaceae bacterium]|jgi:tryptophanyl-tRNA synthetase|nr:tryptophan--tRNA ligase [Xanthomonadaceae bacterium]
MTIRVLTGITTTGTPHLGNYAGAIRPAILASQAPDAESFYFLADYHALIKANDPLRVAQSRQEIAATWLACGLDPERVTFYRQSDIDEIPQMSWLLTCVAAKGLLNRAHAYKAAVDKNQEAGEDPDAGITAGLYMYPVLMAADILIFNAHRVPVGRDQVQHLEMARDIGQRFNHIHGDAWRSITGKSGEPLVLPEVQVDEQVATLPGLDGRKMSKSYDNTIPLFLPATELRKKVMSIVTDSRAPGEPKDADNSNLFQLYQAFSGPEQSAAMRQAFADGIAWGEAKQRLYDRIEATVAPLREKYGQLIKRPDDLEDILRTGARKARAAIGPGFEDLKRAVGLGRFAAISGRGAETAAAGKKLPSFKQYRETDGKFYFKLADAEGMTLLQSNAHDSPRAAGQLIARLKSEGASVEETGDRGLSLEGESIGRYADVSITFEKVIDALKALREV